MSLYNKMTGNLGLFNQFQDTIHRKYRRFPPSSSSENTPPQQSVSKPIQLLRNLDSEIRSIISNSTSNRRKTGIAQSGGSPEDDTATPTSSTESVSPQSDDNVVSADKPKDAPDNATDSATGSATGNAPDSKSDNATDSKSDNTSGNATPDNAPDNTTDSASANATDKPQESPDTLMRRMDELTRLLKEQMAKPVMPTVGIPSFNMALPAMQMPQVSMPTLNDARSALDSAKSFLNVGSFSTDAIRDTFMNGMALLGEAVDKYTRWADEYRQREERLKRDAETNPEYAKVRADYATATSTPPKRAINMIKYVPIDVQRNARIPPTAQLELPAMTEVVRLQNEIYGPRGKPAEQPRQMGPMGPFYRDPIIASMGQMPSSMITEPVQTTPSPEKNKEPENTEEGQGFINISPGQVFNLSMGFIVAQIGAVAYYALKSL